MVDTTDRKNLKVMIPNYLNAASNCIAASHYYSVCCIDECEALFGHIERYIEGPTASPGKLAAFISKLPSSTEAGNRTLTSLQLQRLESIADKHGGYVPIHGRLFRQWMHNFYPRECSYPQLSGRSKSYSVNQWTSMGKETVATMEQMKAAVVSQRIEGKSGQCGAWLDEEELIIGLRSQIRSLSELETDAQTWAAASSVALLCAVASLGVAMISTVKSVKKSSKLKHELMAI
mmetsp:Transcript_82103/g.129311  ORF Transcript_82103/g.129311 Transcript_82103/m.129311 type:complete len:233 (+) Transcript_82103:2-700(+)